MLNESEKEDLKNMIAAFRLTFPKGKCPCSYTGALIPIEEYCAELLIWEKNRLKNIIINAEKNYNLRVCGFEPCFHMCFNLDNNMSFDEIQSIVEKIINWNNKNIKGSLFCVEFWSKKGTVWNPHIHFWVPKQGAKSKLLEAATRKFNKKFNIWVDDGHKNVKAYVLGKKMESKERSIEKDRETRESQGFLHVYEL